MNSQAPQSAQSNLAGIGLMLLGIFVFALNDALGKWLVATYSVGQFLLIRSATTLLLLAPFIWRAGRTAFWSAPRPGPSCKPLQEQGFSPIRAWHLVQ